MVGVSAGGWAANVPLMAFPACFDSKLLWIPATGGHSAKKCLALANSRDTKMDPTFFIIKTAIEFLEEMLEFEWRNSYFSSTTRGNNVRLKGMQAEASPSSLCRESRIGALAKKQFPTISRP